ncbi:TIGR04219 family outer membrane beta-barrel protein [Sulfurimonas sp.]
MKKTVSTLALGALMATTASADFTRVEAGVGAWSYKPSGIITYTDNDGTLTNTSLEKAQSSAYAWLFIKHPIPILPNLRLEYTTVHDDGKGSGSYNGYNFPADTPTTLDLTQYDIIPYYNILDNTFWTTIDIGLDIKVVQYDYTAKGVTLLSVGGTNVGTSDYNENATVVIPLPYLRGRVEIPFTDIGLEADAKYISYGGDTVYDARAKIDYTLSFIPVVQPAIEIGYRVQKYDFTSEDKKTYMNMDFKGLYMGIMARF